MGIPSYYRHLVRKINNFYCRKPEPLSWLLMDYNCLIYQVLRNFNKEYSINNIDSWEASFIDEVCKYTSGIIDNSGSENVYIALDGVVPLAKMRQQRMRRFKSIAIAKEEKRFNKSWDTNAITPGTKFMEKLALALRKNLPTCTISDTSEPGEGEHKLMNFMRKIDFQGRQKNIAIYGLDGDLFVLGLLNNVMFCPYASIYFYREEVSKTDNTSQLVWNSLNALKEALVSEKSTCIDMTDNDWLKEYALSMSLLGNDFVPTGLSFRIKEGGHDKLLGMLGRLHSSGKRLLDGENKLDVLGWSQIFKMLADDEEKSVERAIKSKIIASLKSGVALTGDNIPLAWTEFNDGLLWDRARDKLQSNWRHIYARIGLEAPKGYEAHYIMDSARQYIDAIEWVYKYYCETDKPINFDWMYNYPTAPLFGAVSRLFKGFNLGDVKPEAVQPTANEQLALVLPPESYWLIPKCPEREFLVKAPWYFPKEWQFYSFGKRLFWECEAQIPIPTIRGLREVVLK